MPTDQPPDRPDEQDLALLETLAETGPTTVPQLADRLGDHPATIERRCFALQHDGRIRQCTGGKFILAESDDEPGDVASQVASD
ncbi:winged helix-turn-helix transcriptional regulator [Halobiforma nitratireducens]|uniref:DeoR family transcriptional regulator n=1 Tax=Halobiforma nitratireducens JCM 10879 TaxID=1227454 RepID=M0ME02_9EURY|nr:helix-turn-helix domain-containing protein [Halobiforma nitratireducens]EMA42914.1 DeoR family transcriptional regulator [Halobiforma nitratireducens JCM 10879]